MKKIVLSALTISMLIFAGCAKSPGHVKLDSINQWKTENLATTKKANEDMIKNIASNLEIPEEKVLEKIGITASDEYNKNYQLKQANSFIEENGIASFQMYEEIANNVSINDNTEKTKRIVAETKERAYKNQGVWKADEHRISDMSLAEMQAAQAKRDGQIQGQIMRSQRDKGK